MERQGRWFLLAVVSSVVLIPGVARADDPQPPSLFVMNRDGSGVRHVVHVEGYRSIKSPRWSHDGRRLVFEAVPGGDGPPRLFVVKADGRDLRELGQGRLPCWSPDDKQLAFSVAAGDQQASGTWVQNVDGRGRQWLVAGHAARWSPGGDRMALVSNRTLATYDLIEDVERPVFEKPPGEIFAGFDWSPDGETLALVASRDGQQPLWIVETAQSNTSKQSRLSGTLDGHVSWSPDGETLAISSDGRIQLLRVDGTTPPDAVPGQRGHNRMPAWSPDGKQLAFISDRQSPDFAQRPAPSRRWRLEEGARHRKGTIVYSMAFTPDGRRVVMGGDPQNRGVHVLDLASGELTSLGGQGIRIAMFPDGRRFATSWHSPTIQIIDIDSGDVLLEMSHGPANVRALAVSNDGRRLVSGGLDNKVHVWDPNRGELLKTFDKHRDWLTHAVFSPDGREVISADHGKSVRVWSVRTGKQRLELKHPAAVWGLAVSPDGQHILTGTGGSVATSPEALKIVPGADNTVRLWETSSGKLVHAMQGHTDAAYSLDISPDGRLAASGGWDGTIRLWDLRTGRQLSLVDDREGRASRVAFSPDGRQLIVGGGGRRINRRIVEFPDEQIRLYRLVEQVPTVTAQDDEPESGK